VSENEDAWIGIPIAMGPVERLVATKSSTTRYPPHYLTQWFLLHQCRKSEDVQEWDVTVRQTQPGAH
jgi:hypothetical protein